MINENQLRKKLRKLKTQNVKLKKENRKLKRENKRLIKENRVYRREIQKRRTKERKEAISQAKLFRYSVAYYNSKYDKTFRSAIYTDHELNEGHTQKQLMQFTQKRISMLNKGLIKIFNQSSFLGFEAEPIGKNDIGLSSLNRMYFWID